MNKRKEDVPESHGSCKNSKVCDGSLIGITEECQKVSEAVHALLLLAEPACIDNNKYFKEGICYPARTIIFPSSDNIIRESPDRPCPSGRDLSSHLPNEVILSIFEFVPRHTLFTKCALVCRRWNRLSEVRKLWNQVVIKEGTIELFALGKMLSFGLKKVTVRSEILKPMPVCRTLRSNAFMDVDNPRFFDLQELSLSGATMTNETLHVLLSFFSQLKKLSLPKMVINELSCRRIAANEDLKTLDMSSVTEILSAHVLCIFQSCKKLDTLTMYRNLASINTFLRPRNPPNLITKLDISRQVALRDHHIPVIFQHCPNLLILDISDSVQLTSLAIHKLAEAPHKLEVLFMNHCISMQYDECVFTSLRSMTTLNYLEITGIRKRKTLNIPALAKRKKIPVEGSSFALFVFIYEMREKGIFLSKKQARKRLAANKSFF